MSERFDQLIRLMARLRAPDGCPWDRKQTHESLKPYLIEEAYEVLEAIDAKDPVALREELGDLLLQVLFHAEIGREEGRLTLDEIMQQLADKLVRRHPHVFEKGKSDVAPQNADEVYARWERIKKDEREQTGEPASALEGVPKTLPALLRAYQIQARASRVGFDWAQETPVFEKVKEELQELHEARASRNLAETEAEFGELLFALVNLARFMKVNPEEALRRSTNRFIDRFHYIEDHARRGGRSLKDMTLDEMDVLWEKAKAKEKG
jgi:tetrapyrrole methylase family protein / MazG family protein